MKLLLFILTSAFLLLQMGCTDAKSGEKSESGTQTNAPSGLHWDGERICLEQKGEERCEALSGRLIRLSQGDRIEMEVSEWEIKNLDELHLSPALTIFEHEVRLHLDGNRIVIEGEGGTLISNDLVEDGDLGLFQTPDGQLGIAKSCTNGYDFSGLTKSPCKGTIYVNPDKNIPSNAYFETDIGTVIIVDAFDTLGPDMRRFNPGMIETLLPKLRIPEFDVVWNEPKPIDPAEGIKYFTIGGEQLSESQVRECSAACPAHIYFCDGKIYVRPKDGSPGCSIYAGTCPVTIYKLGSQVRVVVSDNCIDTYKVPKY